MESLNKPISSTERLFDSIRGGEDVATIQDLLQECPDIEARDAEGYTPLLLACLKNRKQIVDLLINRGANVDAKCHRDEYRVLHYASKNGWINIFRTLMEKTPDLDARDIRGETAMHHASRTGCLEIVKCLVDKGADINVQNSENYTPLLCAAEYSRINVVNLLLNSRANFQGNEGMLLCYASNYGWTNLVRSLVKRVPDLNKCPVYGRRALHIAAWLGRSAIVECLLEEGPAKNFHFGASALYLASHRHLEIVKLLVERGIDINSSSKSFGATALHGASCVGQLETVKFLVEKGADLNIKNFKNEVPVLNAAKCSHKDVVDLLIYCGAKVDVPDGKKRTLLYFASRRGWIDTVQSIVKRNCDLDARDINGRTALLIACMRRNRDIVQYLLQAGARWDILDENGYSTLNYVTTRRKEPEFKCIKLFIENGAYLKPVDYEGLVKSSSLKVLQDVELCCRMIVNKFNNHDLPQLYKVLASGNLPRIEEMQIASGSEVSRSIKRAVELDIQTKGHCNVLDVHPMVLRVFSIRSLLEY